MILSSFEKRSNRILQPLRQRTARRALALLKRAEFHQSDGSGELGLVQCAFEVADRISFAHADGHFEDLLGELGNLPNARPAAAQKYARPQIIQRAGLLKILSDELENFLQP